MSVFILLAFDRLEKIEQEQAEKVRQIEVLAEVAARRNFAATLAQAKDDLARLNILLEYKDEILTLEMTEAVRMAVDWFSDIFEDFIDDYSSLLKSRELSSVYMSIIHDWKVFEESENFDSSLRPISMTECFNRVAIEKLQEWVDVIQNESQIWCATSNNSNEALSFVVRFKRFTMSVNKVLEGLWLG